MRWIVLALLVMGVVVGSAQGQRACGDVRFTVADMRRAFEEGVGFVVNQPDPQQQGRETDAGFRRFISAVCEWRP